MRLIFTKESNGDIKAQIHKGTILVDFSYTEMIKQLLENNEIEDTEFNGLEEDEIEKIEEMLSEISDVFSEEENDDSDSEIEDLL